MKSRRRVNAAVSWVSFLMAALYILIAVIISYLPLLFAPTDHEGIL
jgi:hypothetical protein